jgi:hypothetical protein
MITAYVLIQAQVGRSADVGVEVAQIEGVRSADVVAGPYDVIGLVEAANMRTGSGPRRPPGSGPRSNGISSTSTSGRWGTRAGAVEEVRSFAPSILFVKSVAPDEPLELWPRCDSEWWSEHGAPPSVRLRAGVLGTGGPWGGNRGRTRRRRSDAGGARGWCRARWRGTKAEGFQRSRSRRSAIRHGGSGRTTGLRGRRSPRDSASRLSRPV